MSYRTSEFVPQRKEETYQREEIQHKSIPMLGFRTVSNIKRGEYFYIVPWAVDIDRERKPWIKKDTVVETHSHGTATMKIERDSDGFLRATVKRRELDHDFTETTIDSDLYEKVVEVTIL